MRAFHVLFPTCCLLSDCEKSLRFLLSTRVEVSSAVRAANQTSHQTRLFRNWSGQGHFRRSTLQPLFLPL